MKTRKFIAIVLLSFWSINPLFGQAKQLLESILQKGVKASPKAESTGSGLQSKPDSIHAQSTTQQRLSASKPTNTTTLNMLIEKLAKSDSISQTKRIIGLGGTLFTSGSLGAGFTFNRPTFYLTAGIGLWHDKTLYVPTQEVFIYSGGGVPIKKPFHVGGIITLTRQQMPTYVNTAGSIEPQTKQLLKIGIGLQAGMEVKHVRINATIHKQMGLGVGVTYFFN